LNNNNQRLIQSVQRAIQIIDCFDSMDKQLSLSEISERVGLNISTVHGILQTLLFYSYIDKAPESGRYKLGLKFLEKGILVSESLDLREVGHPYLKIITEKYQETSHLCLYQHGGVYCIHKMEPPQGYLIMSSKVGRKLPIHATASGKVIISHLSESELNKVLSPGLTKMTENTITQLDRLHQCLAQIRQQGFSVEDEEAELGAYSIAAPIRNHQGRVFGTISLSGPVVRIKANKDLIVSDLLELAGNISLEFGYHQT